MGGIPGTELTPEAEALGGRKNLRMCHPIVAWAAERVKDGVVLDIGAHFGSWCVPLLQQRPELLCYAFEPNPAAAVALSGMAAKNGVLHQVGIWELALSDYTGQAMLAIPRDGQKSGLATLGVPQRFDPDGSKVVDVTSLDRWVQAFKMDRVQLIKIDVEGGELFVLQGAKELIERDHPALIVEVQKERTNNFNINGGAVEKLLASWGYKCHRDRRDLLCE